MRRVGPEDREQFLRLAQEFYRSPAVLCPVPLSNLERTFDELLRSDVYADGFLLETEEGRCMGYALTAKTFTQEAGGLCVWVEELYVLPPFQGQGVGGRTLALLEEYYPNAKRLRLEVEPENEAAARLYRRLGYEPLPYEQYMKQRS